MEINLTFKLIRVGLSLRTFFLRKSFEKSCQNPKGAQKKVLKKILKLSGDKKLPLQVSKYSDYPEGRSWSVEKENFFETTSGSSGVKKEIPYTPSLIKTFENMFLLWSGDLLREKKLKTGRIFISFSPQLSKLGLQSDSEYLSPFMQLLLNRFLSVKPQSFRAECGKAFLENLALQLAQDKSLEIISIWSPTYLLSLLECLQQADLSFNSELQKAVQEKNWQAIWPQLKLISCWADGASASAYKQLKKQFDFVQFQPKGLLATESPMTIPWVKADHRCIPLWNEVYFEYINQTGLIKPLYDMKKGETGEILISTKGGLLRYALGDMIRCDGYFEKSPSIKFLQRKGEVSDLVGEKLDLQILQKIWGHSQMGYWTLIANQDHYVFVSDQNISEEVIEENLNQVFHFSLARELNQLKPTRSIFVPQLKDYYFQYCQERGMKTGDIKDRCLWSQPEFLIYLENRVKLQPFFLN
ncbi:MAG: GH3 auxin-responsive promoter family protein [Bdellovibrionota bacterium]